MGKKLAIVQSNYIPWKGYFDLINMVDEFVLFDDMQYTKRDWRNRNIIKTQSGLFWLSIPVKVSGRYLQKIKETVVSDEKWHEKHWEIIRRSYTRAPYFDDYKEHIKALYLGCAEKQLSLINYRFIQGICKLLGIKTKISWSMDYEVLDGKSERLTHFCRQTKTDEYVSGPLAKAYIDEALFKREGIKLSWIDYSGYKEYTQLFPPFVHQVSIIDLIFNKGPDAQKYMLSFTGGES